MVLLIAYAGSQWAAEFLHCAVDSWKRFAPFNHSGTSVGAFLIGVIFPFIGNWLDPKTKLQVTRDYVEKHGDALESLLIRASYLVDQDRSDKAIVMLTFDDRKVYVGWIQRVPTNPHEPDSYLRMMPLMSGYRGSSTLQVYFTTFYDEAIKKSSDEGGEQFSYEEFIKIFPLHSIKSASFFRPELGWAF